MLFYVIFYLGFNFETCKCCSFPVAKLYNKVLFVKVAIEMPASIEIIRSSSPQKHKHQKSDERDKDIGLHHMSFNSSYALKYISAV